MTVVVVFWSVRVRTLNGSNYAKTILLLCFAICFYLLGYAMEVNSVTASQILFWDRIQYIGIPFVSALWLTTALIYTEHFSRHKKLLVAALFVVPLITLVLRFTSDFHSLYFQSISFIEGFETLSLVKAPGPWMYVQMMHSMLMILIAMGLFVLDSIKRKEKIKSKILLTVLASFFAIAGLLLGEIKPGGLSFDYMALCLPVTSALIIYAAARHDFLEIKSVARNRVFEAGADAILFVNQHNKVLDYNRSAKKLFEKINVPIKADYLTSLLKNNSDLSKALEKESPSLVKLQLDGEERYYDITTKRIDDNNELRGWIKTIHDVTKTHQLNKELKRMAMTDDLSVLSNRRAFIKLGREWVRKAEESGSELHLAMLDLDRFKTVNDRYGHAAGDMVIQNFAKILTCHFDETCLIARLGGEEFAVLCKGKTDEETLIRLNSLLRDTEQHSYIYQNNHFHITVSIGLAKREPDGTLEDMMRKADEALYQSKNLGRNRITVLNSEKLFSSKDISHLKQA